MIAIAFCGCADYIHEFPEPYSEDPVSLRITQLYLDNHIEPYIIPGAEQSRGNENCKIRFTVGLYQDGKLADTRVLCLEPRADRVYPVDVLFENLRHKVYNVAVWSEFVDEAEKSLAFEHEQITYIAQCKPYRGSTEDKDAFSLSKAEDLTQAVGEVEDRLTLTRPFGKFRIVATDVEQFMTDRGYTRAQIEKMTVQLVYNGFFPCAYNVLENRPNDANSGYQYTGGVSWVDEETVKGLMLTFDYVWVNGAESSTSVKLLIFNEQGQQVASSSDISIPYKRGYLTTIVGNFFGANSGGSGIGINTEFEGVIEVYV